MKRKGLGKGLGKGYKNLAPMDSYVHSMSALGIKVLPLQRVAYGKKSIPKSKREYKVQHYSSPVGTIKEWKNFAKKQGVEKIHVNESDGSDFYVDIDAKKIKLKARGHSKMFQLDKNYYVTAWWENTSYGFRHLATLYENGREVETAKATYYNRTWERYEFQSVLHSLIRKHFPEKEAEKMIKKLEKKRG